MSRRAVLRSPRRHLARSADNRRRRLAVEALEDRRMLAVSSFQDGLLPSPDYDGTRDAPIFASDADVNFGDAVTLRADAEQSSTGQPAWTLIKWDLSSIPAGATVDEVTLTVNVTNTTVAPGFHLFEVKTPWLESEVTWNGPDANGTWEDPGLSNSVDAGEVILGTLPGTALGPLTISLTVEGLDLVQRWVNDPSSNHGFLLANADNTNSVRFDSREGATPADRPMLSIDFDFVDIEPPTATLTFPEDNGPADQDDDLGEVRIGLRDRLEIQLSDYALDDVTVTTETVALTKDGRAVPDVAFSFDAATDLITLTPAIAPFPAGDYLIVLNNDASKIADTTGNQLPRTVFSIQFDNTLPTNPIARDDSYETDEDTPLVVSAENGVLWNDDDGNNPDFVPEIVEVPEHGRLTISEDGSFTYTPDEDYSGTDRFRYQIGTQAPFVDRATVNIDVVPVNDAPVAAPDRFVAVQGETLAVTLPSPSVSDPVRWRVEDGGNGNFYAVSTAQASWAEARDLAAASTFGGVSGHLITITSAEERSFAVANLPSGKYWIGAFQDQIVPDFSEPSGGWRWITGEPFSYTSWGNNEPNDVNGEDCAVADPGSWNDLTCGANDPGFLIEYEFPARHSPYGLLANDSDVDGDGLTVTLVDDVQHGTLVLSGDGTFQYTPEVGFVGVDTFRYQAGDGSLSSNLATVTFSVASISNTPPGALDDAYSVFENNSLNIDVSRGVLANDEDAEGDALVAIEVADPAHGTLTLSDDGSFSYAPQQDFIGTDSFTYRASDGRAESDVTMVTIEVLPVGEDAVAVNDVYTVNIDRVLTVDGSGVLFNDVHPTGEPLTASIFDEPEHGTVTLADDGSFVYTPDPGFEGTDTFTYRASDPSEADTRQLFRTLAYSGQQAPEVPGDTWFSQFGVPVINAAGQTAFQGILAGDNDTDGVLGSLWTAEADGTLTLIVRKGARAPGTSKAFTGMDQPLLTDSGHVAFWGTLSSGMGVWVHDAEDGLRLAVLHEMTAPETEPGTKIRLLNVDRFDVNEAGHIAILAGVTGPAVDTTNDVGIWAEDASGALRRIAREGDPVPGFGGVIRFSSVKGSSFRVPSFNDNDQLVFPSFMSGFAPGFDGVVWRGEGANGLTIVAQEGMDAPGSPGETLAEIWDPRSNDRGDVVFGGRFSVQGVGEGVFVNANRRSRLVARTGDPIPNRTENIHFFERLAINNAGQAMFVASMRNEFRVEGKAMLVEGDDGSLRLVASTGTQVPSLAPGTGLSGIKLPVINNAGKAAFKSSYWDTTRHDAIVAENPGGQLKLIVSTDQQLEVLPGVFRTIDEIDFNGMTRESADRLSGFSDLGQVVFRAKFTDGTSGVFVSNRAVANPVSIATVTINVEPAPYNLPVALDDAFTTDEDTPLIVSAEDGVLANDDDGDLPPLVAVLIDAPEHGEIALSDDGAFAYTPNANYFGADRFTYRITNTFTASEVATVTLGINSVNDAPVAQGDVYETLFGQPFISVGRGVLENDTDVDQQPLSALLQTQPQSGSLVWNGDGTFQYTPEAGFSGVERFTYVAFDGTAVSAETGVRIDVIRAPRIVGIVWHDRNTNGVIEAGEEPLPNRQQFLDLNVNRRFDSGEPTAVSGPDGQYRFDGLLPGRYFVGSLPPADWEITFPNLSAGTSLRHVVELQAGQSFNIAHFGHLDTETAPVVSDDVYRVPNDEPLVVEAAGVLANDTHDEPLTAVLVSQPEHGTLTFNEDGSFLYVPELGFVGTDQFTYRADDDLLTQTQSEIRRIAMSDVPAPGTEAGVEFRLFRGAVLNDSGQVAFLGVLKGPGITNNNFAGIWTASAGGLELIVREDTAAPGVFAGAVFRSLSTPVLSESGHVAFLSKTQSTNSNGIWSNRTGVVKNVASLRSRATGPNGIEHSFSKLLYTESGIIGEVKPRIDATGHVVFQASTSRSGWGVWTDRSGTVEGIAVKNMPAPAPLDLAILTDPFTRGSSNERGQAAFITGLGAQNIDPRTNQVLWSDRNGQLALVLRKGSTAPSTGGLTFGSLGRTVSMNNAGDIAFSAEVFGRGVDHDNNSAYWIDRDGELTLLAREGDPAPGFSDGEILLGFYGAAPLVVNSSGDVAFSAFTDAIGTSLFSSGFGDLGPILNAGEVLPGMFDGERWGSFESMVLNGHGQTAFMVTLSTPFDDRGIWAQDLSGEFRLIAREGGIIEVAPGDRRTIRALYFEGGSGNEDGHTSAFNDRGQVVFTAEFQDLTYGVFISDAVADVPAVNLATVTIDVTESTNQAPTIAADTYHVLYGSIEVEASQGVLRNDSDADGDVLTAILTREPAHGSLSLHADGSFSYTPSAGFVGEDTFAYLASDGRKQSDETVVTLLVQDILVDVALVAISSPSASDAVLSLPESLTQVGTAESYFVEIWIQDVGDSLVGISGASLDLSYSSAPADVILLSHSELFNVLTFGSIDDTAGLVDDFGGGSFQTDAGISPVWARLGYVKVVATGAGTTTFSLAPGAFEVSRVGEGPVDWDRVNLSDTVTVQHIGSTVRLDAAVVRLPSETDAGGEIAAVPGSVGFLHEWETFWVEVWGSTPAGSDAGIAGATFDLVYNTDVATAARIEYGPAFGASQSGAIDDAAGIVSDVGASATRGDVGDDRPVLLARVLFEPTASDQAVIDALGHRIGPYDLGIRLTNVRTAATTTEIGPAPQTELWAVIYDVDDSDAVNFGDFSFFAAAFEQTVGEPEPPLVWWADFDKSGLVDFGDFSFFTANLLADKNSRAVTFPDNYPEAWRPAAPAPGRAPEAAAAAGGGLEVQLVARLSLGADDTLAALPDSLGAVSDAQSYFVEVWIRDDAPNAPGITGGRVDLQYTTAAADVLTATSSDKYNVFVSSSVDEPAGLVRGLGGGTFDAGVASGGQWARLGYVQLTARGDGPIRFTLNQGNLQLSRFGEGNIPWAEVSLGTLTLNSTPADLTGNGFVDFQDLTVLLAAWNQNVSAAEGNLVDADGTPVNFQDLTVLLAAWTGPGPAASPQPAAVEATVSGTASKSMRDTPTTERRTVTAAHFDRVGRREYATIRRAGHTDALSTSQHTPLRRLQATAVDRALADESTPDRERIFRRRAGSSARH